MNKRKRTNAIDFLHSEGKMANVGGREEGREDESLLPEMDEKHKSANLLHVGQGSNNNDVSINK